MPEWSLAASLLIGQSIVKFISGMIANRDVYAAQWERVALGTAFLIVIGLVPCLIILSLVLVNQAPSVGLTVAQFVTFVFGIVVFFAFGAGGEALIRIGNKDRGLG